ncbi:unnamed protein product [Ilex paraguariensis]|uniref:Phytocyanin domain-containing protein n=1 Tax=Ilex paraguariensis TaxID=185542 RepID=A0ABC8QXY4_9AQUA
MEVFLMLVSLACLVTLLFQFSHSATLVVDGVSAWRNPIVQVGDSVIFQHKYHYNLYIFQHKNTFNLCNFTQATLLSKPNSTSFTWNPSRPGFFYFSFYNGSAKPCQEGHKFSVKVSLSSPPENSAASPELPPMAAPPVSSGGSVSSSPAYPWPFRSRELTSPSPAPSAILPAMSPMVPDKGDSIPFIDSNPAVPLPTGEVDSTTIRPLPTSGHEEQVVGLVTVHRALCCVVFLALL